jgi:hypothetical protein
MNARRFPIVAERQTTPWERVSIAPSPIPTMLSREELRYLTWLGAEAWTGQGEILEIGPWLGGSTHALAEGVRRSGRGRAGVLTSMDSFVWKNFMGDRSGLAPADGESFLPHFQKHMEGFGGIVAPQRARLPDEMVADDPDAEDIRSTQVTDEQLFHWPPVRPIEILFVDGAKSYSGLRHLLVETAGCLGPEHSLVIFQDYKFWGAYWVPLLVEMLGEWLSPAHVLRHNTVGFRVMTRASREQMEKLPSFDRLDWRRGLEDLANAAGRMKELGDAPAAAILLVAQVRFLAHKGRLDEAVAALRRAERAWPAAAADVNLERCRAWLQRRLGRDLSASWSRRTWRWWGRLTRPFKSRRRA